MAFGYHKKRDTQVDPVIPIEGPTLTNRDVEATIGAVQRGWMSPDQAARALGINPDMPEKLIFASTPSSEKNWLQDRILKSVEKQINGAFYNPALGRAWNTSSADFVPVIKSQDDADALFGKGVIAMPIRTHVATIPVVKLEPRKCSCCPQVEHAGCRMFPTIGGAVLCGDCKATNGQGVSLEKQPVKEPERINYHAWETPAWDGVG